MWRPFVVSESGYSRTLGPLGSDEETGACT